jgi:CBS domain-containing protein
MGLLRLAQLPPMVSPRASVQEAAEQMVQHHVGAIAITEGRKLLGVFTERDLMKRVVARRKRPEDTPITDVMTARVFTVTDETSVAQAADLMRANHVRHLPIVGVDGELLGMVALRYLLYDMMDDLAVKVTDLEGYLMEDSRGG